MIFPGTQPPEAIIAGSGFRTKKLTVPETDTVVKKMARETGLEPATSTVTGWHSNQLSYSPAFISGVDLIEVSIAVNVV